MALHWYWNEKIGEAEIFNYDKVVTYNLYQGNAFLIFLYEYEENGKDMYNVHSFFADDEHAKRMLGISKDEKHNYFNTNPDGEHPYRLQKIRLNKKKYRYTKKLVDMLMRADFDNLTIELYSEEFAKPEV